MAAAARWLRAHALEEFAHREKAYAVAAVLDTAQLHWTDIPVPVRHEVLTACQEITGARERTGRASTAPTNYFDLC